MSIQERADGCPERYMSTSQAEVGNTVAQVRVDRKQSAAVCVALLTGGCDKPYAIGLAGALAAQHVSMEIVGSDELDCAEVRSSSRLKFLNLRGDQGFASKRVKATRLLKYYFKLIHYIVRSEPPVFHILWHTKAAEHFDRTIFLLFLKVMKKKVAFTAHNVNAARRDGTDSLLNRLTLRIQYHLVDHIFVHTSKMKAELVRDFNVKESAVTVLSYPVNDIIPNTSLEREEARKRLSISSSEKTILFFGRVCSYKGLEYLLMAFQKLSEMDGGYRLIIAGEPSIGEDSYLEKINEMINSAGDRVLPVFRFIPDDEVEVYFKTADVLVLPYKEIFQSGVLFLAYGFGLPVIASDVGSFREAILEGETGFICKACDASDLAKVIEKYFEGRLFRDPEECRRRVREYAHTQHSAEAAASLTLRAYLRMLQ
jgi:D-inositol-3-phosphate glycosyltransferase